MKHFSVIILSVFILSCDSTRVYDDFNDLDDAYWHVDSVQHFSFQIKDTLKRYNIYATFRNSSSYPFYNIYFQYSLKDSSDNTLEEKLTEFNLFDPKTGKPLGSGLGDLFDHTFTLKKNHTFKETGEYKLALQQFMRMDTLPFILSVGARVEFSE
ncbi:MAG: gliding motility lipoprotein GldH [Bacteroidota bacterium]